MIEAGEQDAEIDWSSSLHQSLHQIKLGEFSQGINLEILYMKTSNTLKKLVGKDHH